MLVMLAAAAAAAAEKKGGLPQLHAPDFAPQLIWLAVTFAALYFIMSRIALPKVGSVIEERAARIKRDLDEAERLKGETERAIAAYEKALADARANASQIAKENRDRLTSEVDAERNRVDAQVAAKIGEAESRIAATKAKALASVSEIASEATSAIVQKLTGEAPTGDEVRRALAAPAGE
jgi:F-type H+-transporting ATPase subunit b